MTATAGASARAAARRTQDRFGRTGAAALLCVLWALAYLQELGTRGLRLEEGRRATPAWEMLRGHDFLVPRVYGETYLNKPPLYFWLVAGTGKILGDVNEWAVRLPSAAGALLGAMLLLFFSPRTLSARSRLLAAVAYLSCVSLLDKGTLGEIDALLSALVIGALVSWWNSTERTGDRASPTVGGWIGAGLWMAPAVLLKGPGGPLEFYGMVLPFVWWRRGFRGACREFFSGRHVLFILIAALPTIVWVLLMVHGGAVDGAGLFGAWANQLGLDHFFGKFPAAGQTAPEAIEWSRYWRFVPEVVINTLPWAIWGIAAMNPRYAQRKGILREAARPLWQFLTAGTFFLVTVFWIYPGADPRHILLVAMPISLLAAMVNGRPRPAELVASERGFLGMMTGIAAAAPAVVGIGAVIWAAIRQRPQVAEAAAMAAACAAGTLLLLRLRKRTPAAEGPAVLMIAVAAAILLGRGAVAGVLLPGKGASDVSLQARDQIAAILPPRSTVYTGETLSRVHAGEAFDIQFYLEKAAAPTGGVHALQDFAGFAVQARPAARDGPVVVLLAPADIPAFEKALRGAGHLEMLGEIACAKKLPYLDLLRVDFDRP